MIRYFQLSKRRIYYYSAFIFLTLVIIAAGRLYYEDTMANIKIRANESIASFSEWKIKEILRWKEEKHSEAEFLHNNRHFKEIIFNYLSSPEKTTYKAELAEWLKSLFKSSDYHNAIIIRDNGDFISFFGNDSLSQKDKEIYRRCITRNNIYLTNFRKSTTNEITLDFFIPMKIDKKPFAVLMLRIDPHKYLFPLIRKRPALSRTGESYIFQREQDSIVIISELRNKKDAPLNYKISIKNDSLTSIRAALGFTGIYEGIDYRGEEVLADLERIPHTPWFIISKIDVEEIFLPLREQTSYIIIVFLLLIGLSGAAVFVLWKNERIRYYDQRLKLEQERNLLKQKLEYLVQYANDIIIFLDSRGNILSVNDKAVQTYGYEQEEFHSMTINDIRAEESRSNLNEFVDSVKQRGGVIYEILHRKKNGEIFPVEVSSKMIEVEGTEHLQFIVRDISDRKKAEENLRISAERFQQMFNVNIMGITLSDLDGNLTAANDYYLDLIEYTREEFQRTGMNWKKITPEEFLERDYKALAELKATKSCTPFEKQYITYSGDKIWILLTLALLPGTETQVVAFVQDITARKRAEEALKKSEEKFIKMFDDSPVAMGLFDIMEFKTININRAFEHLYGYSKQEIIGNYPIQEVFADKRQRDFLTLATLKGRTLENYEMKIRNKTGENRVVAVTNVFIDIDNRPCLFSVSYDITDRKRAEEAVKKSEQKFAKMFHDSPVSMVLMDIPTSTTVDVNSTFERLYGYTREEVIGKPPPDIFADPEQLKTLIEHTNSGKTLVDYPLKVKTKSGEYKIFSVTNEFVEVQNQPCVISIAYDITEKKLAEDAIRRSEAQLKQMAEAMPHIIYSAMPDGSIDYINSRFGEYAGLNTQLYYAWEWTRLIHPDDLAGFQDKLNESLRKGIAYENTLRVRKYNGEYEWFLSRVVPIKNSAGQVVRWFGSSTNIHEQRKAYEEVQKLLKELERSNKDLEQFAYVASHDLQEPVRMIKSYIQLMMLKNNEHFSNETKEYMGYITEGATRMQELINDLLKYSRITSKKPEYEIFDCSIIVNEVLTDLKFKIQDENAVINVGSLPMIKADKVQIRQVFQNFIQNALKFRGEKNPEITIRAQNKENFWLFSIKDNGIGIEEKNYGRIFEIFQRLHEREKYPGTGIGLALCKKIIDRHGGHICLDSVPGEGTVFYFTLPEITP